MKKYQALDGKPHTENSLTKKVLFGAIAALAGIAAAADGDIRLMSYNILHGKGADGKVEITRKKPWSYFIHPVTCIGMPLQTAKTGIQVTPEGTVFTGEHELALFFGDERKPLQREHCGFRAA